MPVADAQVQIAVDAVEVEEVELLEGVAVALLATPDEGAHVHGRTATTRHGHSIPAILKRCPERRTV